MLGLYPPRGTVLGNTTVTVTGAEFLDMDMQCLFGTHPAVPIATIISSTKLLCVSPSYSLGLFAVELSLNNQYFSTNNVQFMYIGMIHSC